MMPFLKKPVKLSASDSKETAVTEGRPSRCLKIFVLYLQAKVSSLMTKLLSLCFYR